MNYADYVNGWITPEYGFWKNQNDVTGLNAANYDSAITKIYSKTNSYGIYNRVKFANNLL